jgi:hypothetical protein
MEGEKSWEILGGGESEEFRIESRRDQRTENGEPSMMAVWHVGALAPGESERKTGFVN